MLAILALLVPKREACAMRIAQGSDREGFDAFAPSTSYRLFFAPGYAAACGGLAVGAFMLLIDLGRASAVSLLALNPTFTYLTFGFWALVLSIALTFGLALIWFVPSMHMHYRAVRVATWFALAASLVVAVYTGLLLSSMPAVPFWSSPLLPVLFTLSALSCGCAIVLACARINDLLSVFASVARRVARFDMLALVLEAAAAAALLVMACFHPYDVAASAVAQLLSGSSGVLFLLGFVVVGIVVPLVLESLLVHVRAYAAIVVPIAAACVLVGGCVLRYCIVSVGAHPEVWTVIS